MNIIGVTSLIKSYHHFDQDFWVAYKALEALLDPEEFKNSKISILKSKKIPPKLIEKVGEEAFETEKQVIKQEWKETREQAKEIGIKLHKDIQDLFSTKSDVLKQNFGVPIDSYNVEKLEKLLHAESGLFPEVRIEYKINDAYTLVGIPDLIIKNGNRITIIDWKSNDSIRFKGQFQLGTKQTKKFKYPLSKLEDCDGVQYQLQLSLYAYILQKLNPSLEIEMLKIIQVKNFKKVQEYPVQYLKKEVDNFVNWHVRQESLKKELDKCNLIQY